MTSTRRISSFLFLLIFLIVPLTLEANHAVNISTADTETLATLTGIGEVKAQSIIDYRAANGPFSKIEDIQNVSGIGPATYENIKDHITVSGEGEQQVNEQTHTTPPVTQTGGSSVLLEPQLIADAGNDRTVIVGADVVFEGKTFTVDGELLGPAGIKFLWNFGDGSTKEGYSVMHHFTHPGRYVVTLNVRASTHGASDRIVITAKTASLTLSTLSDGSAVIENKTDRELDLSFWFVKSGVNHFALPEDTVVLENEKIIIPPVSLGFSAGNEWQLLYPNGEVAETAPPPKPVIIHAPVTPEPPPLISATTESLKTENEHIEESEQVAAAGATAPPYMEEKRIHIWVLGFIALTLVGAVGAFFASRTNRKEWDIQEV